ncbi:hypothetical protein M011DRAFT_82286 [Sporormia fimetaria CBS 119925]|uniref:BZIP domain-containing protein n=1 Tax=Sporormia fimetaria CBS 119925 TaxID=1340428 RepID=A0A6A6V6Z8_9PLEO|nr:hypothetical protein M011DRAFT_82286 [Sporormia fimetaria CBS 119925]
MAFLTSSIASTVGSLQTVSPKDIFYEPGSTPPSAALTNITTPDFGESPYLDSYQTSPFFQCDAVSSTDGWYSLFPEADPLPAVPAIPLPTAPVAPPLERTISTSSAAQSTTSSFDSPAPIVLDMAQRRKSSTAGSPVTNAGVSKPRRRKGPLPAIVVDPNDKIALKRARNTLAARDSRQRKFDHVATLEKRNAELEAEVEKWKAIAQSYGFRPDV